MEATAAVLAGGDEAHPDGTPTGGGAIVPNDVAQRVRQVVARVLNCDAAALTDQTSFTRDLGAESLDSVRLVAAFEDEFDIEMDEDEALQVQTLGRAVDFIRKTIEGSRK
jgi:acyl carrier protein